MNFIEPNNETIDSDLSDDDIEEFDNTDESFIQFKNEVNEWLLLDDDIKTLQSAIKERKKKKDILNVKILDFMATYKINDLNTNNGTIKYAKSVCTKPLNKQFLMTKLGDFLKDYRKGEKAATFLMENRDKEEKFRLRRVMLKK